MVQLGTPHPPCVTRDRIDVQQGDPSIDGEQVKDERESSDQPGKSAMDESAFPVRFGLNGHSSVKIETMRVRLARSLPTRGLRAGFAAFNIRNARGCEGIPGKISLQLGAA